MVFHLHPGQDAWTFLGLESPELPKSQHNRTPGRDDPLQHYVELDIPCTSVTQNAVIESTESAQTKVPRIVTHDKHGTVYVPDETGALVPSTESVPALATEPPSGYSEFGLNSQLDTEALHTRPESFIGRDVYRYFEDSGVNHGIVVENNTDTDTNDMIWLVNYDDGYANDFTVQDMLDYCVKCIDGTEILTDAEAITKLKLDQREAEPFPDFQDFVLYQTRDNDTFKDVCEGCGIQPQDWKLYYRWLQQYFNYGHQRDKLSPGLSFTKPWGGTGQKMAKKQSKFLINTPFPIPAGATWQAIKDNQSALSNSTNTEYLHARSVENMDSWAYMQEKMNSKAEQTDQYIDTVYSNLRESLKYEFGYQVPESRNLGNLSTSTVDFENLREDDQCTLDSKISRAADFENLHDSDRDSKIYENIPKSIFSQDHGLRSTAYAAKLGPDLQKYVDSNEYIDKTTGKIKAPASAAIM